jgi:quercetin 2,3-dioxygenase
MVVPPHPHTGLQTVSWLFDGEIEHRDSAGVHVFVRPGEVNLMTAGAGICHSEVSTTATTILHGVQLWVALPDSDRDAARDFAHHVPQPLSLDGASLRIFLGELHGVRSPVHTFTPLLGAQVDIAAGVDVTFDVDPEFEHGVLLDQGDVEVGGVPINVGDLACQGVGHRTLHIDNTGSSTSRVMLLGGTPFAEELVMWWNFVGRSHEDIVLYRELWESENARFGAVQGYLGTPARLPAPPLPTTRLGPRRSLSRKKDKDQ